MSTITRLYLTLGGTTTGIPSANAGAPGLNTSGITSSQSAPSAANYILADGSVIPTTSIGGSDTVSNVTLCIHVGAMDPGATGRIILWEVQASPSSGAPGAVTSARPVFVDHLQGGISSSSDEVIRIPWYDVPDAVFGAGNNSSTSAWYAVQFITKNGTTLSTGIFFEAWLEF
jgi:hypothetical protein